MNADPAPPSAKPSAPPGRRVARIFLWIAAGVALLLLVAALSFDRVVKGVIVSGINRSGEIEAEVGSIDIGILRPRLRLRDVKLYAMASIGGVPMLDLPELYVEYDRDALGRKDDRRLHLRLLRIRLKEIAFIDGIETGPTNMMTLLRSFPDRMNAFTNRVAAMTNATEIARAQRIGDVTFGGVDRLELSVGKVRFVDLKDPSAERLSALNINGRVMTNLNTLQDLVPLAVELLVRTTLGSKPARP